MSATAGPRCRCLLQVRDSVPVTRIRHSCPVHRSWLVEALKKRLKRAKP